MFKYLFKSCGVKRANVSEEITIIEKPQTDTKIIVSFPTKKEINDDETYVCKNNYVQMMFDAVLNNRFEIVKSMYADGKISREDISKQVTKYKETLLFYVCRMGNMNGIKFLFEGENPILGYKDIVFRSKRGGTPLMILCKSSNCKSICSPYRCTNNCNNNQLEIMKYFCEKFDGVLTKDDILLEDDWHDDCLLKCVRKGHINILEYLMKKYNLKCNDSLYSLAVSKDFTDIISLLNNI